MRFCFRKSGGMEEERDCAGKSCLEGAPSLNRNLTHALGHTDNPDRPRFTGNLNIHLAKEYV